MTIDVLPGLVIGVVSMVLLVIYHATRPHISVLGRVPGVPDAYGDVDRHPDYLAVPGLLMLRLEALLFYANATLVTGRIKRFAGAEEPPPRAVILDIGANGRLDITSCEKLSELVAELRSAGVDFLPSRRCARPPSSTRAVPGCSATSGRIASSIRSTRRLDTPAAGG